MGETELALIICHHAPVNLKTPVLLVSLEMGELELAERLLCARSKVDGHKLRTGKNMGGREMMPLGKAYEELHNAKSQIFIDDTPARHMLQITAKAPRLKLRQDLDLALVA